MANTKSAVERTKEVLKNLTSFWEDAGVEVAHSDVSAPEAPATNSDLEAKINEIHEALFSDNGDDDVIVEEETTEETVVEDQAPAEEPVAEEAQTPEVDPSLSKADKVISEYQEQLKAAEKREKELQDAYKKLEAQKRDPLPFTPEAPESDAKQEQNIWGHDASNPNAYPETSKTDHFTDALFKNLKEEEL